MADDTTPETATSGKNPGALPTDRAGLAAARNDLREQLADEIQSELHFATQVEADLETAIAVSEAQAESARAQIEALQEKIQGHEAEITKLEAQADPLGTASLDEKAEATEDLARHHAAIRAQQAVLESVTEGLERANADVGSSRDLLEEVREKWDQQRERFGEAEAQLDLLDQKILKLGDEEAALDAAAMFEVAAADFEASGDSVQAAEDRAIAAQHRADAAARAAEAAAIDVDLQVLADADLDIPAVPDVAPTSVEIEMEPEYLGRSPEGEALAAQAASLREAVLERVSGEMIENARQQQVLEDQLAAARAVQATTETNLGDLDSGLESWKELVEEKLQRLSEIDEVDDPAAYQEALEDHQLHVVSLDRQQTMIDARTADLAKAKAEVARLEPELAEAEAEADAYGERLRAAEAEIDVMERRAAALDDQHRHEVNAETFSELAAQASARGDEDEARRLRQRVAEEVDGVNAAVAVLAANTLTPQFIIDAGLQDPLGAADPTASTDSTESGIPLDELMGWDEAVDPITGDDPTEGEVESDATDDSHDPDDLMDPDDLSITESPIDGSDEALLDPDLTSDELLDPLFEGVSDPDTDDFSEDVDVDQFATASDDGTDDDGFVPAPEDGF